jgi:hypothetical protein
MTGSLAIRWAQSTEMPVSKENVTNSTEATIEQIIERCKPMGGLDKLLIDDLNEEDEDEFFGILEDV